MRDEALAWRPRPQAAVHHPFLDERSRRRLAAPTEHVKFGLDTEFRADRAYANWFWGFTPSCVTAMLKTVGFEVLEMHPYRHAVCLVCAAPGHVAG
jgi:hypothetical protein